MVEANNAGEEYVHMATPRPGTVNDRARAEEANQEAVDEPIREVVEEVKEEATKAPAPKKSMLAAAMEQGMKDYEAKVTMATEAEEQEEMKVDDSLEAATEPSTQFSFHPKGAGEEDDVIESAIVANGTAIDEDIDLAVKK